MVGKAGLKISFSLPYLEMIFKQAFLPLIILTFIFMCIGALPVCISEGVRSPRTEATDRCELPRGCWELNPGPLEEQPVFLTTEPSVHFSVSAVNLPEPRTDVRSA